MNRLTVAGAVVLVLGVTAVVGGVYFSLAQEAGIADVKQTNGTVVSAAVQPLEDGFYPNVTYRYTVGDTEYVSSNVFAPADQQRGAERDEAVEIVRSYRAGQSVTVYYPDDDPAAASLRAPRDPGPVFAFGFGLVAVFGGFTLFVAGRQRDRGVALVQDDSVLADTDTDASPAAEAATGAETDTHGDEDTGSGEPGET